MITRDESAKGIFSVTENLTPCESGNSFAWNGPSCPFRRKKHYVMLRHTLEGLEPLKFFRVL